MSNKKIAPLVSREERLWIAKNAVIEMGKGTKQRIIDVPKATAYMLEQRKKAGMAPFIVIRPRIVDKYKEQRLKATYVRDQETGVYYGIPIKETEAGEVFYRPIRIVESETLNLFTSAADAQTWTILRFHPRIEGSPWQEDDPQFVIFDPVVEARENMAKATSMRTAFSLIDEIKEKPVDMLNFARYMGEQIVDYAEVAIIEGLLSSLAMQKPTEFVSKWRNPSRGYYQIFHAASQIGIIGELGTDGYYFDNVAIGQSAMDVVEFLKKDRTILSAIVSRIDESDEASKIMVEKLKQK